MKQNNYLSSKSVAVIVILVIVVAIYSFADISSDAMFGAIIYASYIIPAILLAGFIFSIYYCIKQKRYVMLGFLIVMSIILASSVAYMFYSKKQRVNNAYNRADSPQLQDADGTQIQPAQPASDEYRIIKQLLATWVTTQSGLSVKAGESDRFNPPSKIQFISPNTILVYYDDGLVDHISVLQFNNAIFTELKNVGVMSTLTQDQWQSLVITYGNMNYPVSNYRSSVNNTFNKVSINIFVHP